MDFRKQLFSVVLVSLNLGLGCGGYTDENVPEKVVTADEMKEMQETQKRIAELGVKGTPQPRPRTPPAGAASN